jgi:hypothetical protein
MQTQIDRYVAAMIQAKPTILGLKLEPFSLGHLFLMQRFECAYGNDDPEQIGSIQDLLLAVLICSRNYQDNLDFFNNDTKADYWYQRIWDWCLSKAWLHMTYKQFHGVFVRMPVMTFNSTYANRWLDKWLYQITRNSRNLKKLNVYEKFQAFNDYRRCGLYVPRYWEEKSLGEGKSGAHWSQSIYQILTMELGYSCNEAMNLPLGRAFAEYFKLLESHGSITLMTDTEIEQTEPATMEET